MIQHVQQQITFCLIFSAFIVAASLVVCLDSYAAEDPTEHYDYNHWAFQPLKQISASQIKTANPIDHFIRAQQKKRSLTPAPPASPRKLIRRVYFDLIGLPPTPKQANAFAANPTPAAYEKIIADLLNKPQYGERWARHWLDVARFAESHGFEQDYDRPYAYHYRDFVIRALNDDMPYSQFVQWQIAGDELAPNNGWANVATGFLGAGVFPTQLTEAEFETARYEELDDMANTVGVGMLALSVGCARCHDHMFDPIPAEEYYRFTAAFATTIRSHAKLDLGPESYQYQKDSFTTSHAKLVNKRDKYFKTQLPTQLEKWLKTNPKSKRKNVPTKIAPLLDLPPSNWNATQQLAVHAWFVTVDAEAKKQAKTIADSLADAPQPQAIKALVSTEGLKPLKHHADGRGYPHFYENVHVLKRGDPKLKREIAEPGFLSVLVKNKTNATSTWNIPAPEGARTSHRRSALARWMIDENNGAGELLARVIVNRIWQHHFGRGIVTTPDDFGKQGATPTHPALLDYLATQLIKNNWRLKPIHQLIMTSTTYRQAVTPNAANQSIDPNNEFLWRRDRIRLEGEAIRDSMLSISDTLDPAMFGPGSLNESHTRRSIYFFQKRSKLIPMMQAFDAPEALNCQGARPSTTVAPQSLMMLNNPNVRAYAKGLANRAMAESSNNAAAIDLAYQYTLSRSPTPSELKEARAFMLQQKHGYESEGQTFASVSPLADFCQVLMCLNEFIYID